MTTPNNLQNDRLHVPTATKPRREVSQHITVGPRSWRIFPRFSAFGTVQKLSGQNHTAFFFREINPFCRHARFDRCRSQDQWSVLSWCASVVTVAAACHTSGLWRILHLSAREFPGAQDAPDSQPIGFLERHSADCSHFSRFVAAKQHRPRYTWLQYLRAKLPRNFPETKVSDLFRTCLDGALRNRTRHVTFVGVSRGSHATSRRLRWDISDLSIGKVSGSCGRLEEILVMEFGPTATASLSGKTAKCRVWTEWGSVWLMSGPECNSVIDVAISLLMQPSLCRNSAQMTPFCVLTVTYKNQWRRQLLKVEGQRGSGDGSPPVGSCPGESLGAKAEAIC